MPIEHFTGNNNYTQMACHVYALSGDHNSIDNINQRYQTLGNCLRGGQQLPANDHDVPNGLNTVTAGAIRNAVAEDHMQVAILDLLCTEFGLTPQVGSGIRIWGHFEEDQMLPEHMYVTTNNMIYDTMPNMPVRRNNNNNGINPPSYGEGHDLALAVIFSIEVTALAAGTLVPINSPANDWADGMD